MQDTPISARLWRWLVRVWLSATSALLFVDRNLDLSQSGLPLASRQCPEEGNLSALCLFSCVSTLGHLFSTAPVSISNFPPFCTACGAKAACWASLSRLWGGIQSQNLPGAKCSHLGPTRNPPCSGTRGQRREKRERRGEAKRRGERRREKRMGEEKREEDRERKREGSCLMCSSWNVFSVHTMATWMSSLSTASSTEICLTPCSSPRVLLHRGTVDNVSTAYTDRLWH